MPNSTSNLNSSNSSQGRYIALALATLVVFAVIWWFLPQPEAKSSNVPVPAKSVVLPETLSAEASTSVTPSTASVGVVTEAKSNTARTLGPSQGSLLANPKPRDMVVAPNLKIALDVLLKIEPNDRMLTALTIEEAEWMDAVGFPTIEEVNSINPADMEKNIGIKSPNVRGLAILAAIWKRQGDPRWEDPAGLLAAWGYPFGTRLFIESLMQQPPSTQRDKDLIYMTRLGNLLGDPYKPYQITLDHRKQWTTWDMMYLDQVLYDFQVRIPTSRAKIGLPPLQIRTITPKNWVTRP